MKLPKVENWTLGTSERVIERLVKLFEKYESLTNLDDQGMECNALARDIWSEGFHLQETLPVGDKKILGYVDLF